MRRAFSSASKASTARANPRRRRLLAETLRAAGHAVTLTREPGGSPGAEEIRRLVLEGDPDRWSAETEILLFTAARRDHLEKTIRPALARGEIVITDRFADSTRIFQGITRGDLADTVDRLHDLMIGVEPDLTLLFDLDPATRPGPRHRPRRGRTAVRGHGPGLPDQRPAPGSLRLPPRIPASA